MRYLRAIRAASIAISKQWPGEVAATTGTGDSALPEHDHEQVGLLRLRRHPGRGPRSLDVEDDERELEGDRKPHRLGLEDDARAARGGDAESAAERGAERCAHGGDLVLGLEGRTPKRLSRASSSRIPEAGVIG